LWLERDGERAKEIDSFDIRENPKGKGENYCVGAFLNNIGWDWNGFDGFIHLVSVHRLPRNYPVIDLYLHRGWVFES
jgi:hypothetical protein